MPAPGEQHLNTAGKTITNPFEEVKPRISEYTAQEIATLQSRLEKQLGPEYISSRAGPSGQKVHYLAAEKCIQLANEVFGFNGWSSQIMDVQVDFVDENPQTFRVSLGLSVIVRVTLRDGTFHEDVGYGHMENCKGKAAAFEKAKKEGTTDALKRALRNFGNVLGNCIYDKEYLKQVTKVKAQPTKWDVEKLHRHSTCVTMLAKKEPESEFKILEEKSQYGAAGASVSTEDTFDDEFGDFDEADFSVADPDSHPDEVVIAPEPPAASHHFSRPSAPNGGSMNKPPVNRPQPVPGPGRGQPVGNHTQLAQPQTPNGAFTRSNSGAGQAMRPPADTGPPSRPMQGGPPINPITGKPLNQPSRNGLPSAPVSPARLNRSSSDADTAMPPQGAGFFSARAAVMLPEGQATEGPPAPIPNNLPAFNPHAESPSIRKTPGIDHKTSKPLTRDLKHVPGSTQSAIASPKPTKIINPQMDAARRIGAPGGFSSPMNNRGSFKQPFKRGVDGSAVNTNRTPLTDLPPNEPIGADAGGDAKRAKING